MSYCEGIVAKTDDVWRSFSALGSKLTRKSDGHVLDSYIMLYLDSIAQMEEHRTFNPRVAGSNPARVMAKRLHEIKFIAFQA